jgi:hypothetical protein
MSVTVAGSISFRVGDLAEVRCRTVGYVHSIKGTGIWANRDTSHLSDRSLALPTQALVREQLALVEVSHRD